MLKILQVIQNVGVQGFRLNSDYIYGCEIHSLQY